MRGLYTSVLVLHVVVAVLGIGLIAAVAAVAATARPTNPGSGDIPALLTPLLQYFAFSLATMLVTGILLDVAVGGAFHDFWWFRVSVLLLIVVGALHGQARRALRTGQASGSPAVALGRVGRIASVMCVLVAAIVVLMEAKPF